MHIGYYSKIIAVDFDGTLCRHAFPKIGEPHYDVIDAVRKEKKKGTTIILWTCRQGIYLEQAVEWCKNHNIPLDYVNCNTPDLIEDWNRDTRKIVANEYWDDKARLVKDGKITNGK